ncbi:hypothetical protein ISN44_As12g038140 [Arabidopsis suecica]|uniref:Uncharacterized protein n=1 Tax=Arabidopsis suecica TaxID=45249 RepID=A0A8T1YRM8_ARASU|nr:hypothetical protein ISN44_As12g038140 [Arabidopsis suecica]
MVGHARGESSNHAGILPTSTNTTSFIPTHPASVTKEPTPLQFHIPAAVLAKIASFVSDDGPDALKNWICAGPDAKIAVFSKETLSRVCFARNPLYVRWSKPESPYFNFYMKCLEKMVTHTLYTLNV